MDKTTEFLLGSDETFREGYLKGKEDALKYIEDRGVSLLQSDKLTMDMAFGISLVLGIVKAEMEKIRR